MIRPADTALTGMNAFEDAISVSSNNLTNVQTDGFKEQSAKFEDLFYETAREGQGEMGDYAGTNPMNIGNGVRLSDVETNFEQGTVASTGGKTDVAIEGDGFFVVGNEDGDNRNYTRDGNFSVSENGFLTDSTGAYVQGWDADANGDVNADGEPVRLEIPNDGAIEGEQTTEATIDGNLDLNQEIGSSVREQFTSFDDTGNRVDVSMELLKTGDNTYDYAAVPADTFQETDSVQGMQLNTGELASELEEGQYEINVEPSADESEVTISVESPSGEVMAEDTVSNNNQNVTLTNDDGVEVLTLDFHGAEQAETSTFEVGAVGSVEFGADGRIENQTPEQPSVQYTSPSTGNELQVDLNLDDLTHFPTDTDIRSRDVNGQGAANVADFKLTDGGEISAIYNDGSEQTMGRLAIATFPNDGGLTREGENNFSETNASGEPTYQMSGEGNAGDIRGQALEGSNVDMGANFSDLMMFQNAYQGTTSILQTADEVVTEIVNLKR